MIIKKILASTISLSICVSILSLSSSALILPGESTVIDFSKNANYNINKYNGGKESSYTEVVSESEKFTNDFITKFFRKEEKKNVVREEPQKSIYYVTDTYSIPEFINVLNKYLISDKIIQKIPGQYKLKSTLKEFLDHIKSISKTEEKIKTDKIVEIPKIEDKLYCDYDFVSKGELISAYRDEIYEKTHKDDLFPQSDQDKEFEKLIIYNNLIREYNDWVSEYTEFIEEHDEYNDNEEDKWVNFWYWLRKGSEAGFFTEEVVEYLFDMQTKYDFWIWLLDNKIIEYKKGYCIELPEVWGTLFDKKIIENEYEFIDEREKIEYVKRLYETKNIIEGTVQEEKINVTKITEIGAKNETYRDVYSDKFLANYEWYLYSEEGQLKHHMITNAPWLSFTPNKSNITYQVICFQSVESTKYTYFDYYKNYYMYLTDSNELLYSNSVDGSKLISTEKSIYQKELGKVNLEVGQSVGQVTLNTNDFASGHSTIRVQ